MDLTYSSDEQQQSKPANRLGGGVGFWFFEEDFEQRVIKIDYQRGRFYHLTFLIGIMKASIIFHIIVPHVSNVWSTKAT